MHEMEPSGALVFLSDLHLSRNRPELTQLFLEFCRNLPMEFTGLFILGDLFDFWVHPRQAAESPEAEVLHALRELQERGTAVHIMPGNRDFALDGNVLGKFRLNPLPDPSVLVLADGQRVLLTHGDLLCTDDIRYQRFRRIIRNPPVRLLLGRLPFGTLKWLARLLRQGSRRAIRHKSQAATQATTEGIARALKGEFPFHGLRSPYTLLLHGHTHQALLEERQEISGRRLVLGDWSERGAWIAEYHPGQDWLLRHIAG